ncbi:uncharacterized protein LOC131427476 [Malaya genurostris]|uniref:uncharacterized protein LOC131427476 n=1 Tax=Malaya genurostris TaxID=325434 RepID=UPI0026F38092|nr:uncharacterized protein LOC131427476 [Malaya genurostris]XP_058446678.1 uncharacterized protein LOC131427476 [Malaya genurostris]XP_058446679.1 uncharacterized protein LOC131427476 [Malaya genurostris]XP_058446680.1 uncharacterized protein LOC131427476 [Malaya genurostris]XP_058446681.1 uncharacterized protein LOC131427476 [Malaya genurostris]XP_058446682.1 uncharacterized protein LOC131427476 [Malaya genurostris]XP_058446683.1 uncharacterized protein LOC131427476 [Malaya genurostris]XP_0
MGGKGEECCRCCRGGSSVDAKFNLMPNKAKKLLRYRRHLAGTGDSGGLRRVLWSRTNGITMRSFIGMLLGLLTISESLALRLTTVRIPTYKFRGESALLECQYELSGQQQRTDLTEMAAEEERLYSIKWYKDNEEFYRYVPSANHPIKNYKIDGIRVDPNKSDGTKVLLKSLSLKSSGVYQCEISAEAPNFDSVLGEGRMDVIYVPKDGPHINGSERRSYHIGERMELNCTSGRSYPASTLQWYLNDQLVVNPGCIINYPRLVNQHGLIVSFLGLSMVVQPEHYIDGLMRIKCVASLSPVLWRNGKESIVQWEQPAIDNRVAMLLVKSSSCQWLSSAGLVALCSVLSYITRISCRYRCRSAYRRG